jgi:hypothetical protein
MRRAGVAVLLTGGLLLLSGTPVSAHGIGGRIDLPIPISFFVWGAVTVLVLSFFLLGALWKEPRLENAPAGRPLPPPLQTILRSRSAEGVVRALSLALFLLVFVAAAAGEDTTSGSLAPVFVYVWFWVGLAFAHVLLGNLWATLSPWDTLARILEIGRRSHWPYPKAWGKWPAAILLFGFVWLELAHPSGSSPRVLAWAIGAYTLVTLLGMGIFGREEWNRNGEAFAVYFGLLSGISPLARDPSGHVVRRPLLAGLADIEPRPGLVAFLTVAIGSTTFDGLSSSSWWLETTGSLGRTARALADTGGLLGTVLVVALAYGLAMKAAAIIVRRPSEGHPLAVRFAHSLVPIAFAYAAAHYFSLLLLEGQQGIPLLSDPLGQGWNLVGTAGFRPTLTLLSANAIWLVQVGVIVAGHVAGVVLAHDRAIASLGSEAGLRSQYSVLAIMVMFTVGGLVILSGA